MARDLLITTDLMFSSQFQQAALRQGAAMEVISGGELVEAVAKETPGRVFIDLNCPSVTAAEVQSALAGLEPAPQTVAYANHVRQDLLDAANAAGFDLILTRGQFHARMNELLG